jgi:hypothetical protein
MCSFVPYWIKWDEFMKYLTIFFILVTIPSFSLTGIASWQVMDFGCASYTMSGYCASSVVGATYSMVSVKSHQIEFIGKDGKVNDIDWSKIRQIQDLFESGKLTKIQMTLEKKFIFTPNKFVLPVIEQSDVKFVLFDNEILKYLFCLWFISKIVYKIREIYRIGCMVANKEKINETMSKNHG